LLLLVVASPPCGKEQFPKGKHSERISISKLPFTFSLLLFVVAVVVIASGCPPTGQSPRGNPETNKAFAVAVTYKQQKAIYLYIRYMAFLLKTTKRPQQKGKQHRWILRLRFAPRTMTATPLSPSKQENASPSKTKSHTPIYRYTAFL
jgi:hypothetical protein